MALNPFQQGQQFAQQTQGRQLDIEAGRTKAEGINALAEMFGEAAKAPQEFATLQSQERQEKQRVSKNEQQALDNQRRAGLDEMSAEDRDRANQLQATRNTIGFFKAGIANGLDIGEIGQRAGPALIALGIPEEELAPLLQQIQNDPAVLDEFEGAIKAQQNKLNRRVVRTIEIENPDGTIGFANVFNDGTTEPVADVTAGKTQTLEVQRERNRLRAAPAQGEIAEAKAEGKIAGEIAGEDLPGSEVGRIAAESAQATNIQRQDFLIDTIDTAIDQAGELTTTGILGLSRAIPGTPAANLASTLDTIKANVGFDELQRLRDNSKTGGALGQVSEMENRLLQSVVGAVEQSQSGAQLTKNLERLKEEKRKSNERIARAFEADFGVKYGGPGTPIPTGDAAGESIDDIINRNL